MNNSSNSPIRHYLYNPHLLDDEDLERGFIVRTEIFDSLIKDIEATRATSPPPHHLIVGQRGMGKSTLLRRVGLELRRNPLNKRFVPLNFPEEQHVEVDRLSKFWLNCLDSFADSLEAEENHKAAETLDELIGNLTDAGGSEEDREHDTRLAFREQAKKLGRRPVLLIDNFHLLLERLCEHDHQLRGFFSEPGAPILVGAALTLPDPDRDQRKAFYDGFKPRVLHPLSLDEIRSIIRRLADGNEEVLNRVGTRLSHLAALRDLTGGNPRTAHLLYDLFASGFSDDVYENLQGLIDGNTPLYQSYLDQLSDQGQVITGVLARTQKPMTAQEITSEARLKRANVSSQLGRLEEIGLIERVPIHRTKQEGYQIAERFFNIWYLLRFSSRRDRNRLRLLAQFLKDFYTPEELTRGALWLLDRRSLSEGQLQMALSLPEAIDDGALARDLKARAELELVEKMAGIHERIAEILDPDEIDSPVFEFAELKHRLRKSVPDDTAIDSGEFVELVISSPDLLPGSAGTVDRNSIAAEKLNRERFDELVDQLREAREQFAKRFENDEETAKWFCEKLRLGMLLSWEDFARLEELLGERMTPALVRLVIETPQSTVKNRFPSSLAGKLVEKWGREDLNGNEPWHERAQTLDQIGWHLGAWLSLQEAIKREPSDKYAWNVSAFLLQERLGRFEEAESAYRKAIEIDPEYGLPWNGLGNLLQNHLGRYKEAESAYRKAIEIDPNDALPWNNLGTLLQNHLGRVEDAESAYRKAVEIDKGYLLPWYNLGILLKDHLGRHEEAESAFRKAIEIDPEYANLWYNLGVLLEDHLGRHEEAESAFRKAIEIDQEYASPWNGLGNLLQRHLGRYDEAESAYRKAIQIDAEYAWPWNGLGNLFDDCLNKPEEARKAYLRALELDPADDSPRHNLAFLLRDRMNQPSQAQEVLGGLRNPETGPDTQALHRALYAAYDENWGLTIEGLTEALDAAGRRLPPETRDDWFRSSAVLLHLGFGKILLPFLEEEKLDEAMLPFVEAMRAHVEGDRNYLRNIIPEARPAAEKIFDEIERRRQYLPESTRR